MTVIINETMAVHAWMAMDRIEPLLQTMVDLPPMIVIRGSLDRGSTRGTSDRGTIESDRDPDRSRWQR